MVRPQARSRITRRVALRAVALGAVVPILAACGSGASTSPTAAPAAPPTTAPAKPAGTVAPAATSAPTTGGAGQGVVLQNAIGQDYLAYPNVSGSIDFSNCWGGARIKLVQGDWITPFNAVYPHIKVSNDVTDCPPLQQKQTAAIAAGSPPNVLMIQASDLAFFITQKAIDPIDDLIKRDKIQPSWYYAGEWSTRQYDGKVYGLPNVTAGAQHLLYYNTNLMKKIGLDPTKAPATWQDLDAMVEPAKKAGLFVMDPAKVASGFTFHMVATYMNGGQYWDDKLTKILWNSPAAVEAAQWELDFVKAQAGKYANLAIAGADRKNTIEATAWKSQKYVLDINGSWFMFQLKSQAPEVEYGVTTFPTNAKNAKSKLGVPITGGWAFCIASAGNNKDAAWEWIKYTTASKAACNFVVDQQRPSPLVACNNDPRLAKGNAGWPAIQKDLQHDVPIPSAPNQPSFVQMWYDMEDAFLYEKMTPKAALDYYAAQGQKLLDQAKKG